jgi:cyclophilin family peptidyl-prolyl cis-trans isomerase
MRICHVVSLLATVTAVALLGCGIIETTSDLDSAKPATPDLISSGPHDIAVLKIRELGSIRFELLPELAPITVAHFSRLAREGLYSGTTFHRVIPGFMIQGGDPLSKDNDPRNDGKGGGTGVESEYSDVPQVRGIVSLAHRGNPNTGGSQFFIMHGSAPHLDGKFSVFGRVIEGLDVLDAIAEVEIDTYGRYGPEARPHPENVVIESIHIEPAARSAL